MSEAKHKLMRDVANIEVELKIKGIKLGEFLTSVPVGRSTWSLWKSGRGTAHAETWQKVQTALEALE